MTHTPSAFAPAVPVPVASASACVLDLLGYISSLKVSFPTIDWRAGTDIIPMPPAWLGARVHSARAGTVMRVELAEPGVIVYWFEPFDLDEDEQFADLFKMIGIISLLTQAQQAEVLSEVNLSIATGGRF
jgi:hypothetical protein